MQPDEPTLIAQIAQGNAHALRQLYAIYRPRLWRYLWRQLDGDQPAVEDALQEVFLAVWRSAAAFRGESAVNTWVFRIAHHYVRNHQRAIARRPEGRLAAFLPDQASRDDESAWDPERWGQESHENEVVARLTLADALDHLSASHREALELVFQQGFTREEVAQILAIPLGTVKSRISYARRALQRELAQSDQSGMTDIMAAPKASAAAQSERLAPSTSAKPSPGTLHTTLTTEERHP
ncbi:MAG TPA: RNA polymerase sigma factor [Ktedonobacterales bacterium]|nr:RNA polymerase sigma factor [Ktedonobacterales bacterium]